MRQLDVADPVLQHAHVADALHPDDLTRQCEFDGRLRHRSKERHHHLRSRPAAQPIDNLVHAQVVGWLSVDLDNLIAPTDARPIARRVRDRSDNDHLAATELDLDANAAEMPAHLLLQLAIRVGPHELGMWIQRLDHSVQRRPGEAVVVRILLVGAVRLHQVEHRSEIRRVACKHAVGPKAPCQLQVHHRRGEQDAAGRPKGDDQESLQHESTVRIRRCM